MREFEAKKRNEISRVCHRHYSEFIDSVEDLMKMKTDMVSIKDQASLCCLFRCRRGAHRHLAFNLLRERRRPRGRSSCPCSERERTIPSSPGRDFYLLQIQPRTGTPYQSCAAFEMKTRYILGDFPNTIIGQIHPFVRQWGLCWYLDGETLTKLRN